MKKIICYLDSEHYSNALFSILDDIELEDKIFAEMAQEYEMSLEDIKTVFCYDKKDDCEIYFMCIDNRFSLYQILTIDSEDEYACIWHHCYNGVDFEIRKTGTYDECIDFMKKDAKEVQEQVQGCQMDEWPRQIILDTGTEWEVWDITYIGNRAKDEKMLLN